MKQSIYISALTFTIVVTLYSCGSVKPGLQPPVPALPASFGDSRDTVSSGTISRKQYFTDTNLVKLIDTALNNNWDILMAVQRIAGAQTDVHLSKAALHPIINTMANAAISRYSDYTMDGAGNKGVPIYNGKNIPKNLPDYFVGLQSSWETDLWGKLRSRKKAAMLRLLSTEEGKNIIVTNLVAELAAAYYELLAFEQTLAIITETITVQEKALDIVRIQKLAAVTNELAVKQFEAQLMHIKGMRLEISQQIAQTENRINFLAGRQPQFIKRDTTTFTTTFPLQVQTGVPAALLQNRPDIKQAALELLASKADLSAAKAAFYPSVAIGGSIGLQAFQPRLLFTTPESFVFGLLGNFTAPLINRAAIKAIFNKASARQVESLYNYHKTIQNGYMEVYNEMLRIQNLHKAFELKTAETITLLQGTEIATTLFRTSRASYLEVLIAQQNTLQARLEQVSIKRNQFLATINIYRALGGGWR